jgi:NDP-sugar pyrophosphorylase family protein
MPIAAVVLAAGLGTRLRPLTDLLPKPLCPVGNVALVDAALERARAVTNDVAVNVHAGRAQMERHLAGRARLSVEERAPLGTAGALGNLRDWIDGRDVLVVNADAWHEQPLRPLLDGWDGARPRLLCVRDDTRADFGDLRYTGAALLPWRVVERLRPEFSGLYEEVFAREPLDFVVADAPFFDCGTHAEYHAANMQASGGRNVVGPRARVLGEIERCVVWDDAVVEADEHLRDAIRAPGVTIRIE